METKSIYYRASLKGKPIRIDQKENRAVKREKFTKLKSLPK
mgnify:CR=1 FL=1